MKTIYLWGEGEGWKGFDFDSSKTKKELELRGIKIGANAKIGNYAKIGYNVEIGANAKIGDYAKIGDNAKIGDDEIIKTIFITGSRHPVLWYGKDIIHVGCMKNTIAWWLSEGEEAGRKEGYSEAELQEYKQYFLICKQLQDSINNQ